MIRTLRVLAASTALLLAGGPLAARALGTGDLLVVDPNGLRVLRVEPETGIVSVFSPRQGAPNLLTSPSGIGTGPAGTIVVANVFERTLVEIDPATGAQFAVEGLLSGPPAIGIGPRDVAVNPRGAAIGSFPTLYVASSGALFQVVRSFASTDGSLLEDYPSPYDPYLGLFAAVLDPGTANPVDLFVATDSIPALLRYHGASGTMAPIWTPNVGASIEGLDASADWYPLVASYRGAPCPVGGGSQEENGVKLFTLPTSDGGFEVSGPGLTCAGPVAIDGAGQRVFVVDAGASPQRVVSLFEEQPNQFAVEHVATLLLGTSAIDLAVYLPEPEGALLGLAALAALGASAAARRSGGASA